MTKIVYRPDPPAEPAGNRRIQRTSQVQNDQAHTRLFEQSLVRAEAERRSEFKTVDKALNQQHQIDKDCDLQSSIRKVESVSAALTEPDGNSEVTSSEIEDDTSEDNSASDDNSVDSPNPTDGLFFSNTWSMPNRQGMSEMFHPAQEGNSSSQTVETDRMAPYAGASNNNEHAVFHESGGQGATNTARLHDLSSFIELAQSGGQLSSQREWSFTFEDDSPISELTLKREEGGEWNVGVTAPGIATAADLNSLEKLEERLKAIGLPVAAIFITENEQLL